MGQIGKGVQKMGCFAVRFSETCGKRLKLYISSRISGVEREFRPDLKGIATKIICSYSTCCFKPREFRPDLKGIATKIICSYSTCCFKPREFRPDLKGI